MNRVATISFFGAGALLLFSAAYIGFAKANGAPMNELPVFGSLFPAEEAAQASPVDPAVGTQEHGAGGQTDGASETHTQAPSAESQTHAPKVAASAPTREEQRANLLDFFKLDSPFSSQELAQLVESLKAKNKQLERRLAESEAKEELIDDRLEALEEREKALERIRTELEERERELDAREEELTRDEKQKNEQDDKAVRALGALFADGEAEELAQRLVAYGPKEAARILVTLTPDRAKELLDALPQAKWREFAEAYTRLLAAQRAAR